MIVRVRLFALARQLAGVDLIELSLDDAANIADLRRAVVARLPALSHGARLLMFAVGNEYARDDAPIAAGVEVACIPPVSGG